MRVRWVARYLLRWAKSLTEREAESHDVAGEVDRIQTETKYRSLQAPIYITALAVTWSFGR